MPKAPRSRPDAGLHPRLSARRSQSPNRFKLHGSPSGPSTSRLTVQLDGAIFPDLVSESEGFRDAEIDESLG